MKKLLTVISCCIFAASVQAQVASSHSRSNTTQKAVNSDYSRIEFSYAPISWDSNGHGVFDEEWTGYIKGKRVSNDMPLYLEYGINAQYAWYSESEENYEFSASVINANIPVNIAYRYGISNDTYITPYFGLHVRGNIIGQGREEVEKYKETYESTANFFDKDDMGSSKQTASRIQLGAQLGIGLDIKNLHIGIGYNTQFSEYFKKTKTSGYTITLGLNI